MKLNEKQFGLEFGKWIYDTNYKPTLDEGYEFKVTHGGTFNLKQWRQKQGHQQRALYAASTDIGIYHKISDMSIEQKPLDAFFFVNNPRIYLVIWFNRYQEFFMIPALKIPSTNSISYLYCKQNFIAHTLLKKKKKPVISF